jgi:hypothetical protein
MVKRTGRMLAASAIALVLAGCAPQNELWVDASDSTLLPCDGLSTVSVEDLGTTPVECDIRGSSLAFPDGTVIDLDEWAGSGDRTGGLSDFTYLWVDVGNFGVVAAQRDSSCSEVQVWGADEAQERVREAAGDSWPCTD